MEITLLLLAALAPAAILFFYVRRKDKKRPEPLRLLLKAFGYGALSAIAVILFFLILEGLGLTVSNPRSFLGALGVSFFGAALPEELLKFFFFWLVVRNCKFFDERMDGIVYASCVALGFAAIENILYLFDNFEFWIATGVVRAIFSVPGHFFFGILMGYYYSLVRFENPSAFNKCMVLAAPIVAHTVFNTLLFSSGMFKVIGIIVFLVVFLSFFKHLRKYALSRIPELLEKDDRDFMSRQNDECENK